MRFGVSFFSAIAAAALLLFPSCKDEGEDVIRVCTYNIRGDLEADHGTVQEWSLRKDSLVAVIGRHAPDVLCLQEVVPSQMEELTEMLPQYEYICVRGLFNPVFYRADLFELLHTETFWLNPDLAYAEKGWDAKYDRYCTWARFRLRKSGAEFLLFNTHLDHRGPLSREMSAALISETASREAGDDPVFICGDMNSHDTTSCYTTWTKVFNDSRAVAEEVIGPVGTAHNFGKVTPVRIDYIFTDRKTRVLSYEADPIKYPNGMYPSDHYPVWINAVIRK